jgi:hypothetical protein
MSLSQAEGLERNLHHALAGDLRGVHISSRDVGIVPKSSPVPACWCIQASSTTATVSSRCGDAKREQLGLPKSCAGQHFISCAAGLQSAVDCRMCKLQHEEWGIAGLGSQHAGLHLVEPIRQIGPVRVMLPDGIIVGFSVCAV